MKKIKGKKVERAFFIVMSLLIVFVANKWFEQAWSFPNDIRRWVQVIIAVIFLISAVYHILPDKE